ncbi:hypothetical protein EAH80_20805 [Mycobacterium hodleri]|uniref:RNA polymerase sigma-70 region 2 domain-containing protein n=1 Tax=Mycolicibacterium hodleri TaxID=49897 RepID=A0A502E608_9MYCO|nr:hypothetical protein EAH80_20805 [Mycolicibacterium hodleri]
MIERASTRWESDGIPANPEAWVLTVARNRLRDLWRSSGHRLSTSLPRIDRSADELDLPEIPDSCLGSRRFGRLVATRTPTRRAPSGASHRLAAL